MSSGKPEFTVRCGGIQATVWANETPDKGVMRSITIDKSYKAGAEWKKTKSYKDTDIPKIVLALNQVYEKIHLKAEVIKPERQEDF